jgi:hypothetical protein
MESFHRYWNTNILEELFDTAPKNVKWDWNSGYQAWEAKLSVCGNLYGLMMSSFPWEMGGWKVQEFDDKTWSMLRHGSWCFEFYEQREDGSQHHDVTGTAYKCAPRVFGSIGLALVGLVKDNPRIFKNICFGGKEANRLSLYSKIAPKLARVLNKKLFHNDKGDHFFLVDQSIPVKS